MCKYDQLCTRSRDTSSLAIFLPYGAYEPEEWGIRSPATKQRLRPTSEQGSRFHPLTRRLGSKLRVITEGLTSSPFLSPNSFLVSPLAAASSLSYHRISSDCTELCHLPGHTDCHFPDEIRLCRGCMTDSGCTSFMDCQASVPGHH